MCVILQLQCADYAGYLTLDVLAGSFDYSMLVLSNSDARPVKFTSVYYVIT